MSGQLEFGEEEDVSATLRRAWDLCLHLLASKVPVVTFETYLRPIQPLSYENSVITLGVASSYAKDWLEKKATNAIRSALEFHLDTTGLQIQFIILTKEAQRISEAARKSEAAKAAQTTLALDDTDLPETPAMSSPGPVPAPSPQNAKSGGSGASRNPTRKAPPKQPEPENLPIPSLSLSDRFLFENFVIGRSNRLAHAGAMHVAAKPGEVYNPLFLYGGPGLGKTHLMQAIAHSLRLARPEARIAYVSGEYFAQHYISALRDHATETFRRQYRLVDVWLVDDIQFIAGKEHTKEEFFHTFVSLYQSGKQIVLASDRSPRELNTMDERLRSRFQNGLIADIGAPDLETRIAILEQCCQREGARIPPDVLAYIASAIQSNIRALEGALTKLIAYSSVMNAPVSAELAQTVLGEYFIEKPIQYRKVTIEEVVEAVSKEFGITPIAILGPNRNKDVSLARQVAIMLCRELMPDRNTASLGASFGGRDHATVVYACQKMKTLLELDSELKTIFEQLKKSLSG